MNENDRQTAYCIAIQLTFNLQSIETCMHVVNSFMDLNNTPI